MYRYSPRNPADDDALWNDAQQGYTDGGYAGGRLPPGPPRLDHEWDDYADPPSPAAPPRRAPRPVAQHRQSHLAREIIETIVLTAVIFVAIHYSVQTFSVSGSSMLPGLQNGEYVLVNKLAYLFHGPSRGDVIVFHYPLDPNLDFIKRVIAVPGDTIQLTLTQVSVNGVTLKEPYISAPQNSCIGNIPCNKPFTLPPGDYFVMGDNRPNSDDSRTWGPLPSQYIIGKATVIFWPLSNWQIIPTYSNLFALIPAS
jgi:signal peptidase I